MGGEVFYEKAAAAFEEVVGDGGGGEVAASYCAFHGGGPLGLGVVAGEVEVGDAAGWGGLVGSEAVDAGGGAEGGAFFYDDYASL